MFRRMHFVAKLQYCVWNKNAYKDAALHETLDNFFS